MSVKTAIKQNDLKLILIGILKIKNCRLNAGSLERKK